MPSAPRSHRTLAPPRWTLSACIFQSASNSRRDSPAPDSGGDRRGPSNSRSANCGPACCPRPPPLSRGRYKSRRRIYLFHAAIVPANRRRFVPRDGSMYGRPAPHPRSNRVAGPVESSEKRPCCRVPVANARVCVETSIHHVLRPGPLQGPVRVEPHSLAPLLAAPDRCVVHLDGAARPSARTLPPATNIENLSPSCFANTRTFATSASVHRARHSLFLHFPSPERCYHARTLFYAQILMLGCSFCLCRDLGSILPKRPTSPSLA